MACLVAGTTVLLVAAFAVGPKEPPEERQAPTSSPRVYSNEDLKRAGGRVSVTAREPTR